MADHPQISVVMRYRDDGAMARFRLVDNETTYYEERTESRWSKPVNVGPTATTVCELLQQLAQQSTGLPITIVLDNARYQKCEIVTSLAKSLGITLLYLPSYSPNPNLIERLWKFVKKTALNSRSYDTFAEFQAAINQCLDELFNTHAEELMPLLNPKFQTYENASILAA